jgi:hypothetical protein
MQHDWGVTVPADVSTETVFEIRDKLRDGSMEVELPSGVQDHPKAAEWLNELKTQMLAAYEKEAARRRS